MSVRPSPKVMNRLGEMAESVVLDPQAASNVAEAQATITKVRRIQLAAMCFSKKVWRV
jgi:hypothetical protein